MSCSSGDFLTGGRKWLHQRNRNLLGDASCLRSQWATANYDPLRSGPRSGDRKYVV